MRKIHNDQKPRRFARKLCSRRRVIGEIGMPRKRSCGRVESAVAVMASSLRRGPGFGDPGPRSGF
jgi:hypothetical protein